MCGGDMENVEGDFKVSWRRILGKVLNQKMK
jgi:hypothetical protein